ncbi:unnamed protein product [Ixodes pacificus]
MYIYFSHSHQPEMTTQQANLEVIPTQGPHTVGTTTLQANYKTKLDQRKRQPETTMDRTNPVA